MNTRYFTSRLLALMLAALLVFSCAAAEETEIPSGVVDNFVQSEIEKQQSASDATAFEAGAAAGEYYADFTFGGVQTLSGITTTLSLYANLPKYAKPVSAVLRLSYTASDLILTDISSLTYYMNGTPFGSSKIVARSDGAQTVLYVSVPVELLTTGYNLLEILSYVRLTDDEGCRDDYNGANWVKIADTTCLRIYYEISDDADELYMYPYPFISLMNPDGAESVVAVSDAADEAELTAAMMLMAGMGNSLSAQNAMTLCRLSDAKSENVLYVGLKKNTPEHLLSLLTQSVPATGALAQRATDGDTSYLLIVAEEEAALSEAAALLSDTSRVAQLHTSQTYVSVGEAQQYALASETSGLTLAGQYTIKDISGNGISFSGPFTQKMTIYLPVAKDYVLSSESRFSFDIRYSENLDFDRSLVTFYWGTSIPLYSHKLTKEGATGETLTFSVPADAIGEAGSSITVVFDLEIKDLDCTVRSMNTPWAYIAANSSLYLPAGENTTLNLANLPAPFQRASRMNNVVMILSDDATQTELTLAEHHGDARRGQHALWLAESHPRGEFPSSRLRQQQPDCRRSVRPKQRPQADQSLPAFPVHGRYDQPCRKHEAGDDDGLCPRSQRAPADEIPLQRDDGAADCFRRDRSRLAEPDGALEHGKEPLVAGQRSAGGGWLRRRIQLSVHRVHSADAKRGKAVVRGCYRAES